MGPMPDDFPISLQSWPSKNDDPANALPTFFKRIYVERGGLRNLTEEGLRQEIADEEAAAAAGNDNGDVEEDQAEEPDRMKELMTARADMLDHIHQAHNEALFALDVVSLLLTKDLPNQASATINPQLREIVPMGSLGADKLSVSRYTEAQRLDNKRVAKGWKIQSLSNAVDSILASATRLENEIAKETKYWEQILAVSDAGWSLCRLPNEKQTLGVRFGFTESAPAFKNRSLAALRRNPDGTIYLDQGITSTEPHALRVRIHASTAETGSSTVPLPLPDDAPIESTILQARNTMFNSELWQEINQESRILGALGVRTRGDTVICPLTSDKTIVLDLVPLGDSFQRSSLPDDNVAEGICLALHLFLSYAHRQKHRKRTLTLPSISNQKQNTEPYSLLRPLIMRMNHQSAVTSAHRLFKPLCTVLSSAKVTPEPSYDIESISQPAAYLSTLSITEATILSLTDRLESIATFKFTEATSIIVRLRTGAQSFCSTNYLISLSPDSPLNITCKPPRPLDQWNKVEEYVLYATSCALASSFSGPLDQLGESDNWEPTTSADVLRKGNLDDTTGRGKQLFFETEIKKNIAKLRVKWEDSSLPGYGTNLSSDKGKRGEGSYEWKADGDAPESSDWDDGEGEVIRSLQDVVEEAGRL